MDRAVGRLLGDRTFRTVAGGEVISVLGDYAYQVAFAWLVLSATGSAATLAAVMVCNVVPNGLLILVGGAVTDRWSPKPRPADSPRRTEPTIRIRDVRPASAGCQPCLALGDSWVHLRMCMTDGEVL